MEVILLTKARTIPRRTISVTALTSLVIRTGRLPIALPLVPSVTRRVHTILMATPIDTLGNAGAQSVANRHRGSTQGRLVQDRTALRSGKSQELGPSHAGINDVRPLLHPTANIGFMPLSLRSQAHTGRVSQVRIVNAKLRCCQHCTIRRI